MRALSPVAWFMMFSYFCRADAGVFSKPVLSGFCAGDGEMTNYGSLASATISTVRYTVRSVWDTALSPTVRRKHANAARHSGLEV